MGRYTSILKMTYSPWLNRAALSSAESIVDRMADDMLAAAACDGCVTEQHLELMGWTPEQIDAHGRAANRRAQARAAQRRSGIAQKPGCVPS